jgi:hypothetical protein
MQDNVPAVAAELPRRDVDKDTCRLGALPPPPRTGSPTVVRAELPRITALGKGPSRCGERCGLDQCISAETHLDGILTKDAFALVAKRSITWLQIEHYLNLALEQARRLGVKPVTEALVKDAIPPDLNAQEPMRMRRSCLPSGSACSFSIGC